MIDSEDMEFLKSYQMYKQYKLFKKYKQMRMNTERLKRKRYSRIKVKCKLIKLKIFRFLLRDHLADHLPNHLQQNKRQTLGDYYQLILPMKTRDVEMFRKIMRMSPESFDELTELVKPYFQRNELISAEECLAITIRYLASGMDQIEIALSFRVEESTVAPIVRQTCKSIGSQPIVAKLLKTHLKKNKTNSFLKIN